MSNSQRASIISSPLLNSVAESIVILRPMTHEGCFSACSTVIPETQILASSRNGPPEAVSQSLRTELGWLAVQALENRRVLAIHRQHAHAVLARLAHDDFAGHDQDLLGCHRDVFAGANGRQRRMQSRSAHDRDQDDVSRGQRGQLQQSFGAGSTRSRVPSTSASSLALAGSEMEIAAGRCLRVCSSNNSGIITRRQPEQTYAVGQIFSHLDGAGADRTRAAQEERRSS